MRLTIHGLLHLAWIAALMTLNVHGDSNTLITFGAPKIAGNMERAQGFYRFYTSRSEVIDRTIEKGFYRKSDISDKRIDLLTKGSLKSVETVLGDPSIAEAGMAPDDLVLYQWWAWNGKLGDFARVYEVTLGWHTKSGEPEFTVIREGTLHR